MSAKNYVATHQGQAHSVSVEARGPATYTVVLDGRARQVDAVKLGPHRWSLIIDGRSHDVDLEADPEHDGEGGLGARALIRGLRIAVQVQNERQARLASTRKKEEAAGPRLVASPMPGRVVKILVKPEQAVEAGQALVIVEAMKMENELRSPGAGRVARIFVEEGQTVEAHAKLISVE